MGARATNQRAAAAESITKATPAVGSVESDAGAVTGLGRSGTSMRGAESVNFGRGLNAGNIFPARSIAFDAGVMSKKWRSGFLSVMVENRSADS